MVWRIPGNAVFADALKALADDFKGKHELCMYWQLAASPRASRPDRCDELVENRHGIPIFVTDFPSPGESMLNSACKSWTRGAVKDIVSGMIEESVALVDAVFFWKS